MTRLNNPSEMLLELYERSADKDSPEAASSLSDLGSLYAAEKQTDAAREAMTRSLTIYRKVMKEVKAPAARKVYGRAIAYQSWALLNIGPPNSASLQKQCRTMLEFQDFLDAADRDSFLSKCAQTKR